MSGRAKGARFENKVAAVFAAAGLDVRSFQRNKDGECDHLIYAPAVVFASECKNQVRIQLPAWWHQSAASAPASTAPLLTFNLRGEMLSTLRTADLARLLSQQPKGEKDA